MLNNKVNISGLQGSQSRLRTKKSQIVKVDRQKNKTSLIQRFYNLPISSKQFIGLITCELVSVIGIGVGSILIINQGLQTQLLEQAKSELTATNVNYDSQANQIGSVFREKAINSTIIYAAIAYNGKSLSPSLQENAKKILEEAARNRKIEYATLVGRDFKIIANANNNRQGEIFNPNNLVSEAIEKSQQITANSVITWAELSQESLSLPEGFKQEDTLIRYTVTPVKEEKTQTVVGALVSGEILSGKDAIAKKTVETIGGGYSAVYFRTLNGEFALATSLYQDDSERSKQNLPLPKQALSLLNTATKNSIGKTVTQRLVLGNKTYAIAAKAIPNKMIEGVDGNQIVPGEEPVAVLVRGTSETAFNDLLRNGWQGQALTIFIGLLLISLWTLIVERTIIRPIKNLQQTAQKFTDGQSSTRSHVFATDEIGQLAMSFNSMADSLAEQNQCRENQAKLEFYLNNIISCIRETLNPEKVLKTLVSTTKEAIQADRVVFYQLDEKLQGKIVAECVSDSFSAAIGTTVVKPYQIQEDFKEYEIGRVKAVDNIQQVSLSPSCLEQLAVLGVKAYLISPIYVNKQLYGLLVAHQCSAPRHWQVVEIDLLRQVAVQAGYALEQAQLVQQVERGVAIASPEEQQYKDSLHAQLSELIDNIESAARGDLTVRAEVTVGEIGTVADFFNSIVESLRDIVMKVQESALQVNQAIGSNEGAVRHLAEEALAQATEIHRTLDAVDNMTLSIQAVAASAEQASTVAHNAAHTVTKSGRAMDMTVQQMLRLRETVSDTSKKVRRLGESTQHISRVVALINQISTQTNLIAINAGIEASRAGEEAQGFVIVAEEVGELAAQTVVATREIEQIVESIQLETTEVVQAMELGTTQVMDGTRIVDDAKQNLNQILDISRQIDLLVRSISEATASQVNTSQVVSQLMKAIAATSQRTSDSSSQVSNSFAQTLQIAKELQQVVGTFQVK
ncbi:HAMP domain-containing protein [Scytonema sp. UIC 10036]|uniref:methyl-accepting chemotaxis protein n=1 Tax=Scytonema sp. UIC 10036 TaxID=2304196 RepID=UPI0012DA3AE8|nr:methyl-accepting chemotaxis protein [Scytonema sp. UIC 10036]MUG97204.1 HAMP domain-containing protein [Scytonema sp. UIC 10036]